MLTSAVEAGRAQANRVALIALECPPACLCNPSPVIDQLNMFGISYGPTSNTTASLALRRLTCTQLQQQLTMILQRAGPHSTCVVLDSVPAMCLDAVEMVTMLADLCNQPHVSSVLARIHRVCCFVCFGFWVLCILGIVYFGFGC